MTPFVQGVVVFIVFIMATGLGMVVTILRERKANPGISLLPKLVPYIVADGLFIVVFVVWVLNQT